MRNLTVAVWFLFLGCGPGPSIPGPVVGPPKPVDPEHPVVRPVPGLECPPPSGLQVSPTQLVLPLEPVEEPSLFWFGQLDAGLAVGEQEAVFAFGPQYPASVTVRPGPSYIGNCYGGHEGTVRWKSLVVAQAGNNVAAALTADRRLELKLQGLGSTSLVLRGEYVQDPDGGCKVDGAAAPSIPFEQRLTVITKRVDSARLVTGCSSGILPAGSVLDAPVAVPVDADGREFFPLNASRAVSLVVSASGGVARVDATAAPYRSGGLAFGRGPVRIAGFESARCPSALLAGPTDFEAFGPEQLTELEGHWAVHAWSKLAEWQPIDGGTVDVSRGQHRLSFRYSRGAVGSKPLCVAPPTDWFRTASTTPAVCSDDGSVVADGVCRMVATAPGTGLEWPLDVNVTGTSSR